MKKILTFTLGFLFLSTPVFAQYKVVVKNLAKQVTFRSEFSTTLEAEKWIASQEEDNAWGFKERIIPSAELKSEDRSLILATYPIEWSEPDLQGYAKVIQPERVKLKQTYSYTIEDITAQKQLEEAMAVAKVELEKCQRAHIVFKARSALKNLTNEQKVALASSDSVKAVVEAITSCSIPQVKLMIQNYVADGVLVSEEDKTAMLEELNK